MAHSRAPQRSAAKDQRPVLLYDRDCRFCRWSLAKVLAWDRHGRLRVLALQEAEADRLLAQIDPAERRDSWHLWLSDGEVRSGGRAIAPLLRLLPGGRPLSAIAQASPRLTDAAYAFVARHRSQFSGLVARWGGG
jgi:predicted DCC family thiol-disulfide oxidoreductase YuxK